MSPKLGVVKVAAKTRALRNRTCTKCRRGLSSAAFGTNGPGQLRPRCRDCERARCNASYHKNREKAKRSQRAYRQAQGEAWAERNRLWREANPDYYAKNLERMRANGRRKSANRRARVAGVEHETIDPQTVYERSFGMCGICGSAVSRDDFQVDHIVPLAKGGAHIYENVHAAHAMCNYRKGAK